jgi:hypothetical protein
VRPAAFSKQQRIFKTEYDYDYKDIKNEDYGMLEERLARAQHRPHRRQRPVATAERPRASITKTTTAATSAT